MTNEEKYKTTTELQLAFYKYCKNHKCYNCPCNVFNLKCTFVWLEREAEEEEVEKHD